MSRTVSPGPLIFVQILRHILPHAFASAARTSDDKSVYLMEDLQVSVTLIGEGEPARDPLVAPILDPDE